jgi:integrase
LTPEAGEVHRIPVLGGGRLQVRHVVKSSRDVDAPSTAQCSQPRSCTTSGRGLAFEPLKGIPTLRPHQVRHTFACRWLEKSVSLTSLQRLLGHSTVVVTQRYGKLDDDGVRPEAERVYRNSVRDAGGNGGTRQRLRGCPDLC